MLVYQTLVERFQLIPRGITGKEQGGYVGISNICRVFSANPKRYNR